MIDDIAGPGGFRYISPRLCREITDDASARRPRHDASVDINLFGIAKISLHRMKHEIDNQFDLARRATEVVEEWTGTLADPSYYVRDTVDLELCTFSVLLGWVNRGPVVVAGAFADTVVPDVGRVFVALFGSRQNFLASAPTPTESDIYPSDAAGLYQILDLTAEEGDPEVDPIHLWDDGDLAMFDRIEAARDIQTRGERRLPSERLSFLARSFHNDEAVEIHGEHFARVVLGAPVWIASPPPRPMT